MATHYMCKIVDILWKKCVNLTERYLVTNKNWYKSAIYLFCLPDNIIMALMTLAQVDRQEKAQLLHNVHVVTR